MPEHRRESDPQDKEDQGKLDRMNRATQAASRHRTCRAQRLGRAVLRRRSELPVRVAVPTRPPACDIAETRFPGRLSPLPRGDLAIAATRASRRAIAV